MARTHPMPILLAIAMLAAALAGCAKTPEPTGHDPATGAEYTVDMKDLAYAPATLHVPVGATVTWVNSDPFEHTVTPTDKGHWDSEGSGDAQSTWLGQGESWSFTFTEPGTYKYYCIPHAAPDADGEYQGMVAQVIVGGEAGQGSKQDARPMPDAAKPVDVAEIGRDGMDVPAPIDRDEPAHLTFDLSAKEVVAEMADGTTYEYWTFDGTVPGPMLRAREGDTITIQFHNDPSNRMGHDIDLHAVTGPGGGAAALGAEPGETASLTFKALNAGLYIYHCAYQDPPLHIAHGMYGLILIEPEDGLEPVDEEFYVVQGDFYSPFGTSDAGHHTFSGDAAAAENPTFVTFNGRMGSLKDEGRQLQAEVGETVRMFVGNGGPNLVSSFHVIGEIFDRSYHEGAITVPPAENVQTTLVPAGGATMVEFDLEVPGDYFLVDHSIYRIHKGAFGVLHVEGEENEEVFDPGD